MACCGDLYSSYAGQHCDPDDLVLLEPGVQVAPSHDIWYMIYEKCKGKLGKLGTRCTWQPLFMLSVTLHLLCLLHSHPHHPHYNQQLPARFLLHPPGGSCLALCFEPAMEVQADAADDEHDDGDDYPHYDQDNRLISDH